MLLKDKISIITGSSKGIGAEIAKAYSKEGSLVIINYNRSEEDALKVLEEIKKYSPFSIVKKFDVSDRTQVEKAVTDVIDKFGKVDILINNAGILKNQKFIDISDNELEEILNTNLKGSFICSQIVAKQMIKQNSGKIINISSISQFSPFFNTVHYAMSKGAIKMLTKGSALELGKYNIKVNTIIPGIIETEIDETYKNKELMKNIEDIIPLRKIGKPSDIADAALFLGSSLSDYITGTEILIDGGFSLFENKNPTTRKK